MASDAVAPRGPDTVTVGPVKVSFNLPKSEIDWVRGFASDRSIPVTQAIRQSIALFKFVATLPHGSRLIVEEPDGSRREVILNGFTV